jgi:hypothetical protein
MTKKTALILLYLLLSIFLPACGADETKPDHYERLHIKAQLTGDWTRVTKYLEDVERAKVWAQYKANCTQNRQILYCKVHQKRNEDPVLAYRKERNMCWCVARVFYR